MGRYTELQKKRDALSRRHPPSPCLDCYYLGNCESGYLDTRKNIFNCRVEREEENYKRRMKEESDRREETDSYYAEKMAHDRGELRKKKPSKSKSKRKSVKRCRCK